MYQLFFTPEWFHGWDLAFEGIGLLIALLIAGYSWKIHRMSSENKYAYFSLAFVLIGCGFFFKLLTHSVLYFSGMREVAAELLRPLAGSGLEYSDLLYRAGFFLQMVAMLGGWLLIFFVSQKSRSRLNKFYEVSQIVLFIYLILLISVISNFKYFVFYLTSMVILGMVVLNYYKNYLSTGQNSNAYLVMNSFLMILISQFCFVFVFLWQDLYVFGEVFLLVGFLSLLYTYRRVTKFS